MMIEAEERKSADGREFVEKVVHGRFSICRGRFGLFQQI